MKLLICMLALFLIVPTYDIIAKETPVIIVGTKKIRAKVRLRLKEWKHRTFFSTVTGDYGNTYSINHNIQMDYGVSTSWSIRRRETRIGKTYDCYTFSINKTW